MPGSLRYGNADLHAIEGARLRTPAPSAIKAKVGPCRYGTLYAHWDAVSRALHVDGGLSETRYSVL